MGAISRWEERRRRTAFILAFFMVAALVALGVPTADASAPHAIISNGTVQLGVHAEGHLNVPGPPSSQGTPFVGLRYVPTNAEATAPGCLCEGWGAADALSGVTGYANEATDGVVNMAVVSALSTPSTSVNVVEIGSTLRVTHDYHPSPATPFLYEVLVTIENISGSSVEPRYRRVMDWDVEPTPFAEFVTIQRGTAANLLYSSDNGFETANPLGSRTGLNFENEDRVDDGPADHGALFDFGFAPIAAGGTVQFKIFYGAAGTEADAESALGLVGAEVFSLGQPSTPDGPSLGTPNTFIFGFSGVGGAPVIPPPSDTTRPLCQLTARSSTGIQVTVQDTGSGLGSIVVTKSVNANVTWPSFTVGTTSEVVVTAVKLDTTQKAQVALRVTDVAGNVTNCDPVWVVSIREDGKPASVTYDDIPGEEDTVTVTNGSPGLKNLDVTVNGNLFKVAGLKDGAEKSIDISAALHAGEDNVIVLTARGKPGSSADVMIWEGQ